MAASGKPDLQWENKMLMTAADLGDGRIFKNIVDYHNTNNAITSTVNNLLSDDVLFYQNIAKTIVETLYEKEYVQINVTKLLGPSLDRCYETQSQVKS